MSETTTGICKYCHQIKVIEHIKENASQEERNAIATHECDCKGAQNARDLDYRIERGRNAIEKIVAKKDEDAAAVFMSGLKATAEGGIQSIQIKTLEGMRYQMVYKGSKITIKSIETNEEKSDGEAID